LQVVDQLGCVIVPVRDHGYCHASGVSSTAGTEPYARRMTPKLAEYIEAGYVLTPQERLQAARALWLSVEQDTDEAHARADNAWDDLIERRVSEVLTGTARLVDGPESVAQARAELAARREKQRRAH